MEPDSPNVSHKLMTQSIASISNIKLMRRCGRVLIGVFILFVATNIFPLNLRSPDWGLSLSNIIVDSAALALVGICLLRYSVWLDLQAIKASDTNPQILLSSSETQNRSANSKKKEKANQNKIEFKIRRLALVGAIGLVLLAAWQIVLFLTGIDIITDQNMSVSSRSDRQVKEVEQRIQGAPDQVIDAEWKKFQATLAPTFSTAELNTAAKRKQLLKDFKTKSQQARLGIEQQVSGARWNLTLNTLRVFLIAITYAWGFYGINKL